MIRPGIVEFPTFGYEPGFRSLATQSPAQFRGGVLQPFTGDPLQLRGLGQGFLDTVIGGFSVQTLALLALGGFVVYRLLFSFGAKTRRHELRKLKSEYAEKRRDVLGKYPRTAF